MRYVPRVDESACAAHGDCVEIAPGRVRAGRHRPGDRHRTAELILEAAEVCPSVAISVIDEDTGEQVYP